MRNCRIFQKETERAMAWYAIVFVAMLGEWWLMKESLEISYVNVIGTLLKGMGDVALILLPYWLLKPKWRWAALIPVWLMAIWCVSNLAYYRFWSDLIPPSAVTMGGNVDGNLMEYGAALLRWTDLAFLIIPCIAWVAMIRIRPDLSPSFRPALKYLLISASLLVGAAGQVSYVKTTYAWRNAISPRSLKEGFADHFVGGYTGQKQLYTYNGPVFYGIRYVYDAIDLLTESLELTDQQRLEIAEFLKIYEQKTATDSVSSGNQTSIGYLDSLNVVYIIVESLNADMVGKKIGDIPVMPTLDSLSKREGTVVIDNVVSQTKAASSSDGHLLLMTGLLPPDKAAYSISYGSRNTFPSLADVLPNHNKYLLLADEGVCWNEGNTLHNFRLGDPLVIKDRPEYPIERWGRDGAMFNQAIAMMKKIRRPFFMTLMTISMHIPFKEEAWPLPKDLKNAEGLSQMEKDYANMCRNTDRWIGKFLKSLPANTLVFIASDHHQSITSEEDEDPRAYFMALNTGRTEKVSRTVGQVNLFPVALEILGCSSDGYSGLAPSAFDDSVDGSMDSYGNIYGRPSQGALDTLGRAYQISDLMIRGDYFKKVVGRSIGR